MEPRLATPNQASEAARSREPMVDARHQARRPTVPVERRAGEHAHRSTTDPANSRTPLRDVEREPGPGSPLRNTSPPPVGSDGNERRDRRDSRPLTVLALSTSLRPESVSRQLVCCIAQALTARGANVEVTDLRNLEPIFCFTKDIEQYPAAYGDLATKIDAADGILLGFPIFNGSPSSSAWNLLQILGTRLNGSPMAMVSAGGSPRGFYSVANLVVWLMFTQGVALLPTTIHATPENKADLAPRIASLADSFMEHVARNTRAG